MALYEPRTLWNNLGGCIEPTMDSAGNGYPTRWHRFDYGIVQGGIRVETFTIGRGQDRIEFEGEKLDEKILGTGPQDTRRITYYKTSDGRYLKHEVFGIDEDEDDQEHRIQEVSSFEIP